MSQLENTRLHYVAVLLLGRGLMTRDLVSNTPMFAGCTQCKYYTFYDVKTQVLVCRCLISVYRISCTGSSWSRPAARPTPPTLEVWHWRSDYKRPHNATTTRRPSRQILGAVNVKSQEFSEYFEEGPYWALLKLPTRKGNYQWAVWLAKILKAPCRWLTLSSSVPNSGGLVMFKCPFNILRSGFDMRSAVIGTFSE